jgi:hypothetical protein
MRKYFDGLFFLCVAALMGLIYFNSNSTWSIYWLLHDTRQGTAVVTNDRAGREWPLSRGLGVRLPSKSPGVAYNYRVGDRTFSGISGRGYGQDADTRINNARPGNELTVYFSESHPWFSSLYRPRQKDFIDELILEAIVLVGLPVGFGIAIWKFRKRGRGGRMAGRAAWATSDHARHGHTTTTSWEMSMEAVQSAGDVAPEQGDTEIVSVNEAVYEATGGRERTYHSLKEMPPKLRAQVEKAFAERRSPGAGHRHASGDKLVPHESAAPPGEEIDEDSLAALDEIPPEARHQFEKFASHPQPGEKITFKFRGPDGREHTYHSLDELPPEVRAIYEHLVDRKPRTSH